MRKLLITISTVLIALSSFSTDLPPVPFINTSGQAQIEIAPTYATVYFSITQKSKNSREGLESLTIKCSEMNKLLAGFKISTKDIEPSEVYKSAITKKKSKLSEEEILLGYELRKNYTFNVKNLSIYPELIIKLLELDYVSSPSSHFSSDAREKEEEKLTLKAVSNARKKAEGLAKAAGTEVIGVYAISEIEFSNIGAQFLLGRPILRGESISMTQKPEDLIKIPSSIPLYAEIFIMFKIKQ